VELGKSNTKTTELAKEKFSMTQISTLFVTAEQSENDMQTLVTHTSSTSRIQIL